ncbi:hypothetical protein PTTG_25181 [Puccinia triticina 1-1 BBBD Race 1]|uniref:Uncharacterized protein n=2 Tax=Puccinia triticina TaxID=208348 RepID=A0A180H6W0_PUCT1|nr:uncharacterized protein PtA15_9A116 [Puccinia triticina]OAW00154.1 hypothetical protein PTTG_25181 [Puccinia triticina 1-1 BBBD Race 1]WAQ87991.1 hypothetical protein PtA15_9A116 [Puccinia triticina]
MEPNTNPTQQRSAPPPGPNGPQGKYQPTPPAPPLSETFPPDGQPGAIVPNGLSSDDATPQGPNIASSTQSPADFAAEEQFRLGPMIILLLDLRDFEITNLHDSNASYTRRAMSQMTPSFAYPVTLVITFISLVSKRDLYHPPFRIPALSALTNAGSIEP